MPLACIRPSYKADGWRLICFYQNAPLIHNPVTHWCGFLILFDLRILKEGIKKTWQESASETCLFALFIAGVFLTSRAPSWGFCSCGRLCSRACCASIISNHPAITAAFRLAWEGFAVKGGSLCLRSSKKHVKYQLMCKVLQRCGPDCCRITSYLGIFLRFEVLCLRNTAGLMTLEGLRGRWGTSGL